MRVFSIVIFDIDGGEHIVVLGWREGEQYSEGEVIVCSRDISQTTLPGSMTLDDTLLAVDYRHSPDFRC